MTATQSQAAPSAKSARRQMIKRGVKLVIACVVAIGLFFAVRNSIQQWQNERDNLELRLVELDRELAAATSIETVNQIREEQQRIRDSVPSFQNLNWSLIALAALLYAIGLVPNGILLHHALHALGQQPRLAMSISAQLIGHVGKYVPGKAMVIVLRTGVLSRDGVKVLPATISIFIETFMMMAAGATLAALIVIWLPVPGWVAWLAFGIAVLAILPTLPPVLRFAAARVSKTSEVREDKRIGYGLFVVGWGWSILAWACIGAAFASLIMAIPTAIDMPSFGMVYAIGTAAISLAVVAGFASLLPGGAGIRELVLTTILSVSFGAAHGLLAAIAARILFLVIEVLLASAGWCFLRTSHSK
ncbi:MAG: lysylphosphatidylglycerol synthase domain-containing protein [Rubripirellula sp.]|nr:lysylphosphatidylglycerol synthase domain-containing protein [Rubripirellula sp.]